MRMKKACGELLNITADRISVENSVETGETLEFSIDSYDKTVIQNVIQHFLTLLTDFSTIFMWKRVFHKSISDITVSINASLSTDNAYFLFYPQIISYGYLTCLIKAGI